MLNREIKQAEGEKKKVLTLQNLIPFLREGKLVYIDLFEFRDNLIWDGANNTNWIQILCLSRFKEITD